MREWLSRPGVVVTMVFATVVAATVVVAAVTSRTDLTSDDARGPNRPPTSDGPLHWGVTGEPPPTTGFGIATGVSATGTPVSLGGFQFCVTGDTPATITDVAFLSTTGVRLRAFAVRDIDPLRNTMTGNPVATLTQVGFDTAKAVVDQHCTTSPSTLTSELGIEIEATTSPRASATTLRISYTAGPHHGAVDLPLTAELCINAERSCITPTP